MDTPTDISSPSFSGRYILTRTGNLDLAFPSIWVAEIIRVERDRVLSLPFYDPLFFGVVHHQGNIVPLILSQLLFEKNTRGMTEFKVLEETIMFVRLGQLTKKLSGVGLIVERLVGSISQEQFLPERARIFNPKKFPDRVWQPLRWIPNSSNPTDESSEAFDR